MRHAGGRLLIIGLGLLAASILVAGCSDAGRLQVDLDKRADVASTPRRPLSGHVYKVGFDPRLDPYEEARIYAPLLDYLTRETGYRFELRFTKAHETIVGNVGEGVVDFAFLGGVSHVRAHEWYGATCLARGLNARGEDSYRAAVVVPARSRLRSLEDLRGRSFAFGNESSTQGRLLPGAMLREAGLGRDDLSRWAYHDSHQAVADEVVAGRYDAGGIQDTLATALVKDGLVKVLAWSKPYPSSGFASGESVDASVTAAVRDALLAFRPTGRDRPGLYHWEKTEMAGGFTAAGPGDYDVVRDAMFAEGMLEREPPR